MSSIPIVVLALFLLLAAAAALYLIGSRRIAPILGALVAGPLSYLAVGIIVPRVTREGRFFSVPFGGLEIGDADLVLSLLTWSLLWWFLLHYIASAKRRG